MASRVRRILSLLLALALPLFPIQAQAAATQPAAMVQASSGPNYVPPNPGLVKKLADEGKQVVEPARHPANQTTTVTASTTGSTSLLSPQASRTSTPMRAPATMQTKALVIMFDFADQAGTTGAATYQDMLFGTHTGTVRDYYRVQSNNLFDLQGDVFDGPAVRKLDGSYPYPYIRLKYPKSYYATDERAREGVQEALSILAAKGFDFSPYTLPGTNQLGYVFAIHSGRGQETTGDQTDIWSHQWSFPSDFKLTSRGQTYTAGSYVTEPELLFPGITSTIGVFAHEFGHMLGLPDLYDTAGPTNGDGEWTLMAGGSWNGPWIEYDNYLWYSGSNPAMLDAWSREYLGWLTPTQVTTTGQISLPQMESGTGMSYRIDLGAGEYLLLENRQLTGYDADLPGAGMLVWHVDSKIMNANSTAWQYGVVNSVCSYSFCPPHYGLRLEEADGGYDLSRYAGRSQNSDPFPGTWNVRLIDPNTDPSTDLYNGANSGISIKSISDSASTMTAYIDVQPPTDNLTATWTGPTAWSPSMQNVTVTAQITAAMTGTLQMTVTNPAGSIVWAGTPVSVSANQQKTLTWTRNAAAGWTQGTYTVAVQITSGGKVFDRKTYDLLADTTPPVLSNLNLDLGTQTLYPPDLAKPTVFLSRSTTPTLVGVTEPGAVVVFGTKTYTADSEGLFRIPLTLTAGGNNLTVDVKDDFGNKATYAISITVVAAPTLTATFTDSKAHALTKSADNTIYGRAGTWDLFATSSRLANWKVSFGDKTWTWPMPLSAWDVPIEMTALQGTGTVHIQIDDAAGWTVTQDIPVAIDETGPAVTLAKANGQTIPVSGSLSMDTASWFAAGKKVTVTGTVVDSKVAAKSVLVQVQPPNGGAPFTVTGTPTQGAFSVAPVLDKGGTWTLTFTGVDSLDNQGAPVTLSVILDVDAAGPAFTGLKVNGTAVPDTNQVSLTNTAWQTAAKKATLTGTVADAGVGFKSATLTLTSPTGTASAPLTLAVGADGAFSTVLSLPGVGTWTATLNSLDKVDNLTTVPLKLEVLPDREGPTLTLSKLGSTVIDQNLQVNLTTAAWMANKTPYVTGTVSDFTGVQSLSVTATPPSGIPNASVNVAFSSSTGAFSYPLNLNADGTWSFDFTAQDKLGNKSTSTLTVVIAQDRQGPAFSGLKLNSTSIADGGTITLANTPWMQAGKKATLIGAMADADAGNNSLSATLTSPTGATTTTNLTLGTGGTFSTTLLLGTSGTWTVALTGKDKLLNSTTVTVTVEVLPDKDGPALTLTSLNSKALPADLTVSLTTAAWMAKKQLALVGTATDISNLQSLTVTATPPVGDAAAPVKLTPGYSGAFSYTLNLTMDGTWTYKFSATDTLGNVTEKTLTVAIAQDRQGPAFSGLKLNGTAIADGGTITLANTPWMLAGKKVSLIGTMADADAGNSSLSVTLTPPTGTATTTNLPLATNGAFSSTLLLGTSGTWTVTLTGKDKLGNSGTATLTVEVLPDKDGPALTLQSLNGKVLPADLTVSLTTAAWMAKKQQVLIGTVTDVSKVQSLTVTATPPVGDAAAPVKLTPTYSGAFSYTLNLTLDGTWTYKFSATDTLGNVTEKTVTVVIAQDRQGPAFSGLKLNGTSVADGGTITLANTPWMLAGKKATLIGAMADADAGNSSLSVTLTSPTGTTTTTNLTLGYSGTFSTTLTLGASGTWTVALTGKDKLLNSTTATVTVEVLPDKDGPALTLQSLNSKVLPSDLNVSLTTAAWLAKQQQILVGAVTDISKVQALTVTVTKPGESAGAPVKLTPGYSGAFSYTLNLTTDGTWTYKFSATDTLGNITEKTLTVAITPDDLGPAFSGLKIGGTTVTEDTPVSVSNMAWMQAGKKATLTGVVTDAGAGFQSATLTLTSPTGTTTTSGLSVGTSGAFSSTLSLPATGTWTVALTAKDKLNNTTPVTLKVEVLPDREAPAVSGLTLAGRSFPADLKLSLTAADWYASKTRTLRGVVTDATGVSSVSITITDPTGTPTTKTLTRDYSGAVTYSLNLSVDGEWNITFTTRDTVGNEGQTNLVITVAQDREAPQFTLKANNQAIQDGDTLTLTKAAWTNAYKRVTITGSAIDAGVGLSSVKYQIKPANGSYGSLISISSSINFSVSLPTAGTYEITLVATDKLGQVSQAVLTVVVQP